MEHVNTAPQLEDFTLLSEHQEQTPGTFFGGKPVLHLHAPASTVKVSVEQYETQADLKRLVGSNAPVPSDGNVNIPDVDVWITSRHLLLFTPTASSGLQIPYPAITVTAQDGADVLLELNLSDADTADEDIQFMQLRIFATHIEQHAGGDASAAAEVADTNGTIVHSDTATALFKAISDCQELNPDPLPADGDEEGEGGGEEGFDETAPGATGWITSENMAEFMDEDGNFRMPGNVTVIEGAEEAQEPLGEGAGRTRTAAERDGEEDDESKWQRTG